jgi:hypothetical protein
LNQTYQTNYPKGLPMPEILRAMISSTAKDLAEYRKAVMDACLSVGVFPSMMEHLPASDADAVQGSLRMVDGADLYIGVFAHRYGYIPQASSVSVTELEYNHAVERGIPILLFMIDVNQPVPSTMIETGDAREKLRSLKDKLQQHHIVNFFTTPDALRAEVIKSLWHTQPSLKQQKPVAPVREPASFSASIKEQLAATNKKITELTTEQYQVINMLRYQRRMAIAGCAGSGKTLIAAEKAIRLDQAGLRTMLLCHSRYLATYMQGLVKGSGIYVVDFTTWIQRILGNTSAAIDTWTHYEEPTAKELEGAFDKLAVNNERYDAIIIDEGQDFRDDWWLIVESALASAEYGTLIVFHDDNQALLPYRSAYPIQQAPIVLSKNCRNAGAIFEIVRRFHPQSPETSLALKHQGIAKRWEFEAGNELSVLGNVVREISATMSLEKLVILTTEPDPAETSRLHGTSLEPTPTHRWQDYVTQYLVKYGHFAAGLSDSPMPTPADIKAVVTFAKYHFRNDWGRLEEVRKHQSWRWELTPDGLTVKGKQRIAFFAAETWAEGIPSGQSITINAGATSNDETLGLFTVSAFKGLESDAVVLFIPAPRAELSALAYVGLSRAKLVLHILIERRTLQSVKHILGAEG